MTEITDNKIKVSPATQRFILHWGDLGSQWGVNRSVAQIHALLLMSDRPLTAETIAETLSLARSNVSNSLKDLTGWELVKRAPIFGDRRDHFEAEGDVWEMARKIVAVRKSKELDPAADILRDCLAEVQNDKTASSEALKRLSDLKDLIETLDNWYGQMSALPKAQVQNLFRLGAKAIEILTPFLGKKPAKEKNVRA